jgi:hypothetical protein
MWLVVLLACGGPPKGPFQTPDEACWDKVHGEAYATQGADEAITRYNCYRNFLGISQPRSEPNLQQAAHAHAKYMATNGTSGDTENEGDPDFTGVTSTDRLLATGYAYSYPFWPVTQEANIPPAEIVDQWVDDGFARELVTTPGVVHAGFAQVQGQVSVLLAFPFPLASPPIVYPADGQIDVPLSYFDQPFGYPISVSVGSAFSSGRITNVYDLEVLGASLVGPDGDVAMEQPFVPEGPVDAGLLMSAVFVPSAELQPDSTYTFTATISWIDGSAEITSTFTTKSD